MSETLKRSAHRRRHARADGAAQEAARRRRQADRLEGRARRAGHAGQVQSHRADRRLSARPRRSLPPARRSRSPAGRSRSPRRRSPPISAATCPPAPTATRSAGAIAALGPAIELADVDGADGRRAGRARRRHLPAPCDPRAARHRCAAAPASTGSRAASPAAARMSPSRPTSRPTSAKWSTSCAMSPTWPRRSAAACAPGSSSSAAR